MNILFSFFDIFRYTELSGGRVPNVRELSRTDGVYATHDMISQFTVTMV